MKIRWRYKGDQQTWILRILYRKLRTFVRVSLGIPRPNVKVEFLGHSLLVMDGTIRIPPDDDDAWVLACQRHASSMFDIGCHIGYTALMGLLGGRIDNIVLVDASADALSIAARNLIQNQIAHKARFVNAFVTASQDSATVPFFTGDAGAASSAYITSYRHSYRGQLTRVPTISVDSLVERYGITPDFVKVDVEGAEDDVLVGSQELAKQRVTRFVVEVHHHLSKPISGNTERIMNWCDAHRYQAYLLATHSPLHAPDQVQGLDRYHLLLQPREWEYPSWLQRIPLGSELVTNA